MWALYSVGGTRLVICDPWLLVRVLGRCNIGFVKCGNNCEVGCNRTKRFLPFKLTWSRSLHLLITYFDVSPTTENLQSRSLLFYLQLNIEI